MPATSHLLMVRPVNFTFNPETAVNNAFQVPGKEVGAQENAAKEFDDFVSALVSGGVDVTVINDTPEPFTPDSIFPNNWVSFHANGTVCLFPMYARNRRLERKQHVIDALLTKFKVTKLIDFSYYENENLFLEGTGSVVLDRDARIAYACLSPRTDKTVLQDFCKTMGYKGIAFSAVGSNKQEIYHTNVMMCVTSRYVIVCLDAVADEYEKDELKETIKDSGKKIFEISMEQMNHFAGNMLQVKNKNGENLLVMSTQAYQSLAEEQVKRLNHHFKIIHSDLTTIEANGGGSARCMMAEIFLPEKN
ncbi:MAG: amidinotransferase [Bacteroidetes bacterium]|nr:amidinotransferase [Bacteroidota bacterium]MBS1974655.1 amidinotransferase [Bacteroidota bacterium]